MQHHPFSAWHTIGVMAMWESTLIGYSISAAPRRRYVVVAGIAVTIAVCAAPAIARRIRRTR